MEWYISIIIAVVAGLLFGHATRNKRENEKINFAVFFIIAILSFFLTWWMPLLITILCAIAYGIYSESGWKGLAGFIAVGIIFIAAYHFIPATTEIAPIGNTSLIALHGNFGSDGSFFLGCGDIGGNIYYTYSYMQGTELIQGVIEKNESVHVYPNRTDERAYIYRYRSLDVRNLSPWYIQIFFYGTDEKIEKDSWIDISIPPDSIIQGVKV